MIALRNRKAAVTCLALVVCCLMNLTGCSKRGKDERETKKLEGIADKIDLQNKAVSMRVVSSKGNERVIEGTFRDDTVVIINDREASLEQVKPGDKVIVYGHREGKDQNAKLIATKVIVTRPEGTDWQSQPDQPKEEAPADETPATSEGESDAANAG